MIVTVYTKPDCVQCEWTKRHLKGAGVSFTEVPVDESLRTQLADQGFTRMPVVITDTDRWDGFRIDKIRGLRQRS